MSSALKRPDSQQAPKASAPSNCSPAHSRLVFAACQFAVAKRLSNELPNNGKAHGFLMDAHEQLDSAAEEYFNAVVLGNDQALPQRPDRKE